MTNSQLDKQIKLNLSNDQVTFIIFFIYFNKSLAYKSKY